MTTLSPSLPWLEPGDPFPSIETAWRPGSHAPGLLAAGGALDVDTLKCAYSSGIFPWFSEGQPILWWSPDPRMVLQVADFRLHRSMRHALESFRKNQDCVIRFDSAFAQVIQSCATAPRRGQSGTWILPEMVDAYTGLHHAGVAHSVETWINEKLVGGLYCVALGRAVFGESMFANETNTSKIALAALVAFCRHTGIVSIDCQQNTRHLASLGASEIPRNAFMEHIRIAQTQQMDDWRFTPVYWDQILSG